MQSAPLSTVATFAAAAADNIFYAVMLQGKICSMANFEIGSVRYICYFLLFFATNLSEIYCRNFRSPIGKDIPQSRAIKTISKKTKYPINKPLATVLSFAARRENYRRNLNFNKFKICNIIFIFSRSEIQYKLPFKNIKQIIIYLRVLLHTSPRLICAPLALFLFSLYMYTTGRKFSAP
jgi:hypothetical protein